MKKIIKPILILLVIATCLYPTAWFAWRMGRPMELPQYKNLTFYQFMQWRKMAYADLASQYQASHPEKNVKFGMCQNSDVGILVVVQIPMAGYYTLAGIYPSLQSVISTRDKEFVPADATWRTFLPTWWLTLEKSLWITVEAAPQTSVPYCRLQPNVPSPEEFRAR
jgi:hypothetical protein